jgi:hypothetical protein
VDFLLKIHCPISNCLHKIHHQDSIIMGVRRLWEVVTTLVGVEDHQEREANLWEELVDPRVEVEDLWCAFWCSLTNFPLEPMAPTMVSTTSTHYPCGSFIKEIVTIPNLFCWTPTYLNTHVQVFQKTIHANGEKHDVDIMNLFCFTLRDANLEWGKKFM